MRTAVFDLGSNSFRLLVVDVTSDGALATVARDREELGLGAVVARDGVIDGRALEAAQAAVRRFRAAAERLGASPVLPVATSAIRDATNRDHVLAVLSEAAGVSVRLLDGKEEARLSFIGMRAGAGVANGSTLTLDLGGGSLDVAFGDDHAIAWADSCDLGGARLTALYLEHDPPTAPELDRLHTASSRALAPMAARTVAHPPTQCIAAGGSVRAIARLAASRRWVHPPSTVHLMTLSRQELRSLQRELATMTQAQRLALPTLKQRKQDVLPAASAVLAIACEAFDLDEIVISEWGLREGVIIEAFHLASETSTQARDLRRAAVRRLELAWAKEPGHGDHVAELAVALFDATRELHGLDDADRELLDHAAHLHDIGESIAFGGHHKHGAYLIEHSELHGFGADEIAAMASIVRFHKGSGPKPYPPFDGLPKEHRQRVTTLTALLRVADGLDCSHEHPVERVDVSDDGDILEVRAIGTGEIERALDGSRAKADLLAVALGREIRIVAVLGEPDIVGAG